MSRGCRRQDGYGHDMLCGSKGEPLSVERLTRLLLNVELLLRIVAFLTKNTLSFVDIIDRKASGKLPAVCNRTGRKSPRFSIRNK